MKSLGATPHIDRRAMTLLELILALALSVVVLSAVGAAIRLYFKMLDARRTSIEEMQAVRVVVMRMTNDIRACVHPYKPDLKGLETTFQNAMQAATAQVDAELAGAATIIGGGGRSSGQGGQGQQAQGQAGGGQQGGGQQGQSGQSQGGQRQGQQGQGQQGQGQQGQGQQGQGQQSGQSAGGSGGQSTGGQGQAAGGGPGASGASSGGGTSGASSSSSATDSAEASASPTVVLTGTATELRFDISRLPRIDQYQGLISKGELSAVDLPSDVKTIVYFLRSETSAQAYAGDPNAPGGEPSIDFYGRGLMRAELDRAVSAYAGLGGGTEAVYETAQLLSEDVVGLGFEYYDGTDFLTEWDSASQGLPRAIRIWLSVQSMYGMTEEELARVSNGGVAATTDFYFTVSLPTTPPVIPAATESAESTDAAGAAPASSTSSATSSATQGAMP